MFTIKTASNCLIGELAALTARLLPSAGAVPLVNGLESVANSLLSDPKAVSANDDNSNYNSKPNYFYYCVTPLRSLPCKTVKASIFSLLFTLANLLILQLLQIQMSI